MHGVDSLEHAIVNEAIAVKVTMDTQYKCSLACGTKKDNMKKHTYCTAETFRGVQCLQIIF